MSVEGLTARKLRSNCRGRWLSESAWSVEALTAASDAAHRANGATLPKPPHGCPANYPYGFDAASDWASCAGVDHRGPLAG